MTDYLKYIIVPIVIFLSFCAAAPMVFGIFYLSIMSGLIKVSDDFTFWIIALVIYSLLGVFVWKFKTKFLQFCGVASILANAIGVYFFLDVISQN